MKRALLSKLRESLISVLPVSVIILIVGLTPLAKLETREIIVFLVSSIFLILGISLFNLGADLAMTPLGEQTGTGLTKSKKLGLLFSICFVMGVLITIAEPDLSVLAEQVSAVINPTLLIVTVGAGVGLFLLIAVIKIVFKKDLTSILMFFYMALFILAALLYERGRASMMPLAFDSGGVTTGPITVPFIMALGVGIALTMGGREARENSFGLVALCSVGPILAVLVLSLTSSGSLTYEVVDYSLESGFDYIMRIMGRTALEVARSLGLILLFLICMQKKILKFPIRKIIRVLIGMIYTFVGLVIFLTAVSVGFMPVGYKVGTLLAQNNPVYLAIFAFIIGCTVVLAEPAVHVLNKQVEDVTGGTVTKLQMTISLAIGVGTSILLSVIRIIFGFSLLYYLIPGYLIALGLSFFVPKLYTAIAFDSGGVASGPLTSSFILPMAIGACVALQGSESVMSLAFGVIAMVAMTPLITIQILGFRAIFTSRMKYKAAMKRIISADDEQIIYFKKKEN